MESYQKAFIELSLAHEVLRFGEFTLKSGRVSPYFFNMGNFSDGQTLAKVGECYAQAIHHANISFDLLFGPAYKGIPLVCACAIALSQQFKQNFPYSFNRKEAKDHGEKGTIIGANLKGRVLVLDDVITAGTAMRESFNIISAQGAHIAAVLVALDRQEKGSSERSAIQEIQDLEHIPAFSIISFEHIIEYVREKADFSAFREPMKAYRDQYGVT